MVAQVSKLPMPVELTSKSFELGTHFLPRADMTHVSCLSFYVHASLLMVVGTMLLPWS